MTKPHYATAPIPSAHMPPGVPFIVANEAAERFSFYGMKCILVIFMTQHLLNRYGDPAPMSEEEAKTYFHLFCAGVYFFPLVGALLADSLWGKYYTIMRLSVLYCLGHLALAVDETRVGLLLGLLLITLGSGGIKSCVSAHVGDQFGASNQHLLAKVFGWFYFAINLGAFASTLLTPALLHHYGPGAAFGVPGVLMALATLFFWLGRWRFVHIPPGGREFVRESFSAEGLGAMAKLSVVYVFVAMFWALFDQTGSAWVLQAKHMQREIWGYEILPSQIQAANPLLIMLLIPLFSYAIYPMAGRWVQVTPLRKIATGMFVTVAGFAISAWIEHRIVAGGRPHIIWQVVAYTVLTSAEIMISITCLEFSYTQAPRKMKSLVMGLYFCSVSLGNAFTAGVNWLIQNPDGTSKLSGPAYYWFFTGTMLLCAVAFIVVAANFREQTYIQEEQDLAPA